MTPLEIYDSFIIKANENAQTDNIAVDKARFTYLYNEASIKFVEWTLEKKNDDDIRYLAPVLVPKTITDIKGNNTKQKATLPVDYLDLGNINAKASSTCCQRVAMELWELKTENINDVLNDEFSKPSIDYRDAPFSVQGKELIIFVDDFTIDEVELTYYKYPKKIELSDPEDPESTFKNPNTQLEFDDKAINRIISIAVSDFDANTNNPKFQVDKSRVTSKF